MNDLFWYKIKLREAVSATGMENGWDNEKCKEVFDELMDKYLEELTPLSKSQIRRITKVKSDELRKKGEV